MLVNKYLLLLFCLLMLANITMLFDLQSSTIINNQASQQPQIISQERSTTQGQRLARLESSFEQLSAKLTAFNQSLKRLTATSTPSTKVRQGALADEKKPALSSQKINLDQARPFAESIENVFELGVLDEHAWQSMEQDISTMSKEESKVFWTTMMAKIAQDEFVIGDYKN